MIKICAWCNKPMGLLSRFYRLFKMHKEISHGICWECHDRQVKKLRKLAAQKHEVPLRRGKRITEVA